MRKLIAMFLSVMICINVFSGMAFAAPVAESESETVFESIEFNGTEDLIQKTIQKLAEEGKVITELEKPGAKLINSVEACSGMSFDAVKTAVADALTENRESGKIDVSRFNLNKSDAAELMTWVLKDYFLTEAVSDVRYVTNASGVTVEIRYTMSDGMSAALDEMQNEKESLEDDYDIGAAEDLVDDEVIIESTEKVDYLAALDEMAEGDEGSAGDAGSEDLTECVNFHSVPRVEVEGELYAAVQAIWEVEPVVVPVAAAKDAELVFDSITGDVSVVMIDAETFGRIDRVYTCTSATFQCAKCGEVVTYTPNDMLTNAGEQTIYYMMTGELAGKTVAVPAGGAAPAGTANVDWISYTNYAIAVFPDDNTVFDANFNPDPETLVTIMEDVGAKRVSYYYSQMSLFNSLNADLFGISAPYWTSKNTESNPMAAVKALCNQDVNADLPPNVMLEMVQMLPRAFMSYVMNYEHHLLAMKDLAMAELERLPSNATEVQKLLVLHDWLAQNATFDMGSMNDVTGSGGNNDPMQMTTFGAILSEQLDNYHGGICLAYAAAYTWLVQWAFPEYYQANGEFLAPDKAQHMVDFVQIKFFADTSETSVAGAGFGGGYFNNVHYFNAVKVADPTSRYSSEKDWFYADVCYDDISVECISQYRVEADGNLSHMNFLTSPKTIESLYKSSTDYIDSLYDGYTYVQTEEPYTDDDGNIIYNSDGTPHLKYEMVENPDETAYDNASYEDTWFSGAISPIHFDGTNWYYVDSGNTYVAYKDYMDENGDFDIGDMGNNMGGDYDMGEVMHDNRVDPANADKLKVRSMKAPDYYTSNNNNNNNNMMGQNNSKTDPYAEVLIKYGFGHVATNIPALLSKAGDTRTDAQFANQSEGNSNNNYAGMTGMILEECQKDFAMNELYPGLVHTIALYDNVIYFNLANAIYTLDLADGSVGQLKEYNDVYAVSDATHNFKGASFSSVAADSENIDLHVKNRPIASFAIRDEVVFTPVYGVYNDQYYIESYNVSITPTLFCAIATNLAHSYPLKSGSDSEFDSYTKEASNYNPDYQRGISDDDSNDNCEFLWCANIRDKMAVEEMLADYATLKNAAGVADDTDVISVTVGEWCEDGAFTDIRTAKFGLSDGSSKEFLGEAAGHHFEKNEDGVNVCRHCLALAETNQNVNNSKIFSSVFTWETDENSGVPVCTSVIHSCFFAGCSAADAHLEFKGNQITNKTGTNTCTASVKLNNGTTITDYRAINAGDVDADDKINALDIGALSDYLNGTSTAKYNSNLADINKDGKIDSADLSLLRTILSETSATTSSGVNSASLSLAADPDSIRMNSDGVATFDVIVSIAGNANFNRGVSIIDASLTYDNSILKLKAVSEGSLMRVTNNTPNALMFETEDLHKSTTASGVLAILTFELNAQFEENTQLTFNIKADSAARYNTQSSKFDNVAVSAGSTTVNVVAYCPHEETTLINAAEATCTVDGYTGDEQCNKCGEIAVEGEVIPAIGHALEVTKEAVAATCTEKGHTGDKACSACDYVETGSDIDALGHTEEVVKGYPATCTTTGLTDGKKCSVCGETLLAQEEIAALGHTEVVDSAVAPTCTQVGYTEGKHCSVCNAVLVAQEKVAALGHDMIIDAYKAPTCTADGFEEGEHCSRCDEVTVAQVVIPALGHDMVTDAYVAPTCVLTGLTEGEHCSRCDDKTVAQESIPALGHKVVILESVDATCTTTGLTEGKYCSVCEETLLAQKVIEALGHDMITDEAVAPTCTETGLTEGKHCSRCDGATVAQAIVPAMGHDMVTDTAVVATCTQAGLTEGKHCSRCDGETVAQVIIPALGHTSVADAAVAPTCTTTGLTAGEHCSHCDAVLVAQETIPALGHEIIVDAAVAPTCTETGLTEGKHCSRCDGETVAQKTVPALGHDIVKDAEVAATCTEAGLTAGEHCSRCDKATVAQETVPAKGHSFDEWTLVKAPTLTEEGIEVSTCSACGEKQTRAVEKLEYLVGDANSDGQITAADARILLRLSAKLEKLESYNVPFAVLDVNGDGQITASDARKVLRQSAKLDD